MLHNKMRGSIKTATDFWLIIGFLFLAGIGIHFVYSYNQEARLKNGELIVDKDSNKSNTETVKESKSK